MLGVSVLIPEIRQLEYLTASAKLTPCIHEHMLIGGCSSILQDSLPQAKELEKDYDYYDES